MRKRQGQVLSEHQAGNVSRLKPATSVPMVVGSGDITWVCGHCDHHLAEGIMPGQINNLILICYSFGALNYIFIELESGPDLPSSN